MQPTETPDNSKNGNEGEVVLMKRKGGPEDAPKEATNGSASPSDALNSASVLRVSNPTNHDGVKNDVGPSKAKRRKRTKSKNKKNAVTVKPKKTPKKSRKRKPKSDLKAPRKKPTDVVAAQAVDKFESPRESHDAAVETHFGGGDMLGLNEVVPEDVAGTGQYQSEKEILDEDVSVDVTDKTIIAWEHFALLIEEYLLAKDVRM